MPKAESVHSTPRRRTPAAVPHPSHVRTETTPEEFFRSWSRKDKELLIEVLIDTLDAADGDADDEPSLAFAEPQLTEGKSRRRSIYKTTDCDQRHIAAGATDDRERDDADDPRGEEVDEDGGYNSDYEPTLGWTESGHASTQVHSGKDDECEGDIHTGHVQDVAKARHRHAMPPARNIRDGMHVDAESCFDTTKRRLFNLTNHQRAALAPRVDRDAVRI